MAKIHISKDPPEQAAVAFTHDPLLKIKIKNDMIYEKLGEWLHGHRPLTGCRKTLSYRLFKKVQIQGAQNSEE